MLPELLTQIPPDQEIASVTADAASGTPVTKTVDEAVRGKGSLDRQTIGATEPRKVKKAKKIR